MHGTFRSYAVGTAKPVNFEASTPAKVPCRGLIAIRAMLLAAGCGLAVLPRSGPAPSSEREQLATATSAPDTLSTELTPAVGFHTLPGEIASAETSLTRDAAQAVPVLPAPPLSVSFVEVVAVPVAAPAAVEVLAKSPVLLVGLPPPADLPSRSVPVEASVQIRRLVDVEQIAESEVRSLQLAQRDEPELAAGSGATLAARIDAMQVPLPPPLRIEEHERAALLAEAPTEMMVRIGDSELGKVAFRTSGTNTVDVQLAGLLDLLVERFDSSEFERLRNSAAADNFVGFDQLRALGLNLRYDPVYDELRISG